MAGLFGLILAAYISGWLVAIAMWYSNAPLD
jgi:hypothetical protein